jgi:hypothetical protein
LNALGELGDNTMSVRDFLVIGAVAGGAIYAAIAMNAAPSPPTELAAAKPAAPVNVGAASPVAETKNAGSGSSSQNDVQRVAANAHVAATESPSGGKHHKRDLQERGKHH